MAQLLADVKRLLSPRDRKAVRDNLRVVCGPDKNVEPLIREVFRNFGKYLVDFFRMPAFTEEFIRKHVVLENRHLLDAALEKGKGVIIMTAHIGNWELGGLALGRYGYPLTAIALPHKEQKVNEFFNRQRMEGGVTVVPVNLAIRRCLQTLKKNGIIALLADRDFSATGLPVPLFGKETMIPRGIALFAYRTGAVVLPSFLTRTGDFTFRISIDEPLQFPVNFENMSEEDFTREFMKQQVGALERKIREDPGQWLLFRRFWIDSRQGPERITST